jgi:hypothetical protein
VRPDVRAGEWALLLRRPVYAIVATSESSRCRGDCSPTFPEPGSIPYPGVGEDDAAAIPDDAPTDITQRVREHLDGVRIPGRILPAARTIAAESAQELFSFILIANSEIT